MGRKRKYVLFSRESITGFNQSKNFPTLPALAWKSEKSLLKIGRFNYKSQIITIKIIFYKLDL